MKKGSKFLITVTISLSIFLFLINVYASSNDNEKINNLTEVETDQIEKLIEGYMSDGEIPGLAVSVVKEDKTVYQRGFGYSDIDLEKPVTSQSIFELASNSKAFTALAILTLEDSGQIDLNDKVTKYIPWLKVKYKGNKVPITIEQVLHQTSGIPAYTINMIPVSNEDSALEDTVRTLIGIELDSEPGKIFQYATINYDILGLIIEMVTGSTYESYMDEIILIPMELNNTYLFRSEDIDDRIVNGHKIGFLKPKLYEAPIYRGNKPAGYIMSCAEDMSRWIKIQMDTINELDFNRDIIKKAHEAKSSLDGNDNEVLYAGGWFIEAKEQITHDGMNPNYSSFITFNNKEKIGIAVLSNISSNQVQNIGLGINEILDGEAVSEGIEDSNQLLDKVAVVIIIILGILIIALLALITKILIKIFRKQMHFKLNARKSSLKLIISFVSMLGLSYFIYIIPKLLLNGFSWGTVFVWSPSSIKVALYLLYLAIWFLYALVILKSSILKDSMKFKR